MWVGPFQFICPLCGARPGKPCMNVKGPKTGRTCKTHGHRVQRFRQAQSLKAGGRDPHEIPVPFETNRSRH
jgi:hypothetical protein